MLCGFAFGWTKGDGPGRVVQQRDLKSLIDTP
jgi:hypothetical protein